MKKLKDKEFVENFIKIFTISWLSFMGVSPYFLCSFVLMNINIDLGFKVFDYFFGFFGPPTILAVVLFVLRKQNSVSGGLKEFIANNTQKVFLFGVILFYLLIIVSIFININNLISGIMIGVFSVIFFPVAYMMLRVGQKNITKMKEIINKVSLPENTFTNNN